VHENSRIFSDLLRKVTDYLYGMEGIKFGRPNQIRRALMKVIEGIALRNITSTRLEVEGLRSRVGAFHGRYPDPLWNLVQSNTVINNNHINEIVKFEMTLALDFAIEEIQKKYADVIREYYLAKQRLT
jgi:hypothetical protein